MASPGLPKLIGEAGWLRACRHAAPEIPVPTGRACPGSPRPQRGQDDTELGWAAPSTPSSHAGRPRASRARRQGFPGALQAPGRRRLTPSSHAARPRPAGGRSARPRARRALTSRAAPSTRHLAAGRARSSGAPFRSSKPGRPPGSGSARRSTRGSAPSAPRAGRGRPTLRAGREDPGAPRRPPPSRAGTRRAAAAPPAAEGGAPPGIPCRPAARARFVPRRGPARPSAAPPHYMSRQPRGRPASSGRAAESRPGPAVNTPPRRTPPGSAPRSRRAAPAPPSPRPPSPAP